MFLKSSFQTLFPGGGLRRLPRPQKDRRHEDQQQVLASGSLQPAGEVQSQQ